MTESTPLPAEIVAGLTLEEKAALTSGGTFWTTKGVESAGIPKIMLTDGPHGLRKQRETGDHLGIGDSVPATCFPPAVGLGSSWDVGLVERVGEALGTEAAIENVAVLLGPGLNIKRSPLCGRNFEYVSEDPIVSGEVGAALVRGIQSKGVGASVKHFAANNQENDRMRASSDVDERPLREVYLRGFQRVVEDAQPWTVMCSYNRINGVYASEDPWLLTHVLRDEWGFDGLVVSDWGAVNERVASIAAGMDLEMPSNGGETDAQIIAAVRNGTLAESVVDVATTRIVNLVQKSQAGAGDVAGPLDVDAHHALAREAAGRGIVLLKNERETLPISSTASVAVIGLFAEKPRYQGAGSSKVTPTRLDNARDEIAEYAGQGNSFYAQGYKVSSRDDADSEELRRAAVELAAAKDVAVLFLGLPEAAEAEGYDREHIDLPDDQLALLDAVLGVTPNVVVVLSNGSVVALPFADRVPAIIEAWLLGQAGGGAIADVLYGAVNPSAKLTETIPLRLQDNPSYLNFGGTDGHVRYGEGLFVGYRWYDARDLDVAFPFGHGLSYTTFEYSDAVASVGPNGDVEVRVRITNTGDRAGREVVQIYTSLAESTIQRPVRELKAFASVALDPGETRDVMQVVRRDDLAYWHVTAQRWVVEGGDYTFDIAASSRDLRARATAPMEGDVLSLPLTRQSSLGEAFAHPIAGPIVQKIMAANGPGDAASIMPEDVDMMKMIESMPLGRMAMFPGDDFSTETIDRLIATANAPRAEA
ncbi:glycoside hydrolase family 3 C-terminal domain-containing protein [Microbacterium sp. UFMG61]|uniref:glycoside hydrolase family 3 C-terminal domain-containing protein n=1 Tax=Microbacterium sp. UFMG61 TaxID=2745935 RepID=UPI00188F8115|nr:glycoside hydrolase family 3 C-terminal domain-containing protein [Microbacterium sp. UFMG61]